MQQQQCLYPKCDSKNRRVLAHGFCRRHYGLIRYYISKGMTTWEILTKRGKAKYAPNRTRQFRDWLLGD